MSADEIDPLRLIAELRAAREVIAAAEAVESDWYDVGTNLGKPMAALVRALAAYRAVTGETEGHGDGV